MVNPEFFQIKEGINKEERVFALRSLEVLPDDFINFRSIRPSSIDVTVNHFRSKHPVTVINASCANCPPELRYFNVPVSCSINEDGANFRYAHYQYLIKPFKQK